MQLKVMRGYQKGKQRELCAWHSGRLPRKAQRVFRSGSGRTQNSKIFLHWFRPLKSFPRSPGWCSSVDWVWAVNQRVTGLILSQGTCLGCGPGPWWGPRGRQPHIDVSLSLSPSLSLSLKSYKTKQNKTKKSFPRSLLSTSAFFFNYPHLETPVGWTGVDTRLGNPPGPSHFILLCLRFQICEVGRGNPFFIKLLCFMRTCMGMLITQTQGMIRVRFWGVKIVLVTSKSKKKANSMLWSISGWMDKINCGTPMLCNISHKKGIKCWCATLH